MKHHHLTGNVHYLNQLFSLLVGAQFAEQSLTDIYIRAERRQHFVVHRCVELFQKLVVFLLLLELYERRNVDKVYHLALLFIDNQVVAFQNQCLFL